MMHIATTIGRLGWLLALAWPRPASAEWIGLGAGMDGRSPTLTASVDAGSEVVASVRGIARLLDGRADGEVTALIGLGPRLGVGAATRAVAWDRRCLAILASGAADPCWVDAAPLVPQPPRAVVRRAWAILVGGRVGAVAGAEPRVAGVAAVRWHFAAPGRSFARDLVELGVTGLVIGRDRPYLMHEPFMPGWYARVQVDAGVVIALESGVTGLAMRDASGVLRPELYGRASILLAWGR